jgi:hypothetical protein
MCSACTRQSTRQDSPCPCTQPYTGHPELPTLARHLLLGPVGQPARYHEDPPTQAAGDGVRAEVCVYEHCQQVLELLQAEGLEFTCQIADRDLTLLTTP